MPRCRVNDVLMFHDVGIGLLWVEIRHRIQHGGTGLASRLGSEPFDLADETIAVRDVVAEVTEMLLPRTHVLLNLLRDGLDWA